eukprot:CAMPEP_0203858088 /NCGR_PEP_ID=MMETSP0359-20131031/11087_1 /ASSEMBLY_ACC=CAM_ASM_000338 /TAXON_ID=268821 /ORGANISM="Scrippsiella Hangoei, Strain SHTV-5" /LENGTH=349 /DNA_ID=CAMNT_0050774841 /DNA_START=3 /DNA_END=1052 /DNA_ORIENTATION=-
MMGQRQHAKSYQDPARCLGTVVRPLEPAQSAVLVQDGLLPQYRGWWNMPIQQSPDVLSELKKTLYPVPWGEKPWGEVPEMRAGLAKNIIPIMFEATKVSGVFEKMPKKMRGIYWMKGNGVSEELTILHYGQWFPEHERMIVPFAPFTWAWPGGRPRDAPMGGAFYSGDFTSGLLAASVMINGGLVFSYKYSTCEGSYCRRTNDDMAFAYMQVAAFGNMTQAVGLELLVSELTGGLFPEVGPAGAFTLEEMPGSEDGSVWKRTCFWGFGSCAFMEFGSYDLVKIVGEHGEPVQPHYDEFIEYMGEVPLIVWAGWADEQAKKNVADRIEARVQNGAVSDFVSTLRPGSQSL